MVAEVRTAVVGPYSPLPTPTPIPDYAPPSTSLQLAGQQIGHDWYRSPVTLTFNVTDDLTGLGVTAYKLDGAAEWSEREHYHPPLVVNGEGRHRLEYRSIDKLFNTEAVKAATINIDLTAPTASHTLDGVYIPNGWYGSPVTVNLAGQDNLSGIAHYEVNLNGSGWLPTTAPPLISVTGRHTLTYRAVDRAGNVSMEEIITLNVDTTPSTTTHVFSGNLASNGWYTSPVTVTLVSTDTGAGHHQTLYRLDNDPDWRIYGDPFVVNTDGHHSLKYYATDRANNTEATHIINFDLDLTPPASAYPAVGGAAGANGWYVSPITISLTAIDG